MEFTEQCRLSEDLRPGAYWCRKCYRYKAEGCDPTQKMLVRFGKKTKKSKTKKWITRGDPTQRLEKAVP